MSTEIEALEATILKAYNIILKRPDYKPQTLKQPDGSEIIMDTAKAFLVLKKVDFVDKLEIKCSVELRDSSIHGKGLFATDNIKGGSIITFYPGDMSVFYPNEKSDNPEAMSVMVISGSDRLKKKTGKEIFSDEDRLKLLDYQIDVDEEYYSIIGDPSFTDNPRYLGHMINDTMTCSNNLGSIRDYFGSAHLKTNAIYKVLANLLIVIIAEKDIKKNEEILMNYGLSYWLGKCALSNIQK